MLYSATVYFMGNLLGTQGDLIYWYIILSVALIVMVFIIIVLRQLLKDRTPSADIKITMNYDSLEKMQQTGLLSKEEFEQTRSAIKKQLLESIEEEEKKKEEEKAAPLTPKHPRDIAKEKAQQKADTILPETKPHAVPELPADLYKETKKKSKKPSDTKPIDVEDLYKRGVISEEEYRKLKNFFENK